MMKWLQKLYEKSIDEIGIRTVEYVHDEARGA